MITKLEWILTNSYKAQMISYLKSHPEDFEEAIELAISDKPPYSWRAAWLLWSCMETNDLRIQKFLKRIISSISTKNDAQQREMLIILQKMDINTDSEGYLFDHCIKIWEKTGKKPSVRYNAFKMIIKLMKKHPDLSHELPLLTQDQYLDPFSPTAKKSIFKMINELS
jgi:hypothetical protein